MWKMLGNYHSHFPILRVLPHMERRGWQLGRQCWCLEGKSKSFLLLPVSHCLLHPKLWRRCIKCIKTFTEQLQLKNRPFVRGSFGKTLIIFSGYLQCRLTGPQGQGWSTRQTPMRADWTHRIHPLLRCTEFFYRRISFGLASSFAQQGARDRYLCWVEFWQLFRLTNIHQSP